MGRDGTDVSSGMARTGSYEQLLSGWRPMNLAFDLELHVTFDHQDQLVGFVDEVLPALTRRIDPQTATESSRAPATRYFFLVDHERSPACPTACALQ
jgi:hypothetical protein